MNTNPDSTQKLIARHRNLVVQEIDSEVLVYDMDTDQGHCLNHSAAFIWRACDGNNTTADIVKKFETNRYGKLTEDLVWIAIDQLIEKGLLENEIAPRFTIHSRRQVLKTVGLVSSFMLPIVASLVAPQRAYGVSSCDCISSSHCGQAQNAGCPSTTNCNNVGLCAPNTPPRKT